MACEYEDWVIEREVWGSHSETLSAVTLRKRDIAKEANIKKDYLRLLQQIAPTP